MKNADGEWLRDVMARKAFTGALSDNKDAMVLIAPLELPDAEYTVEFDRQAFQAENKGGFWVTANAATRCAP